jgi:transcriptional regulator with GAF, ATPase, and Fis domain
MPAIYAVLGPIKGTTLELGNDEITIGRDSSNQLKIPDLRLSRRHCSIKKDGDTYTLQDLNSTNGILLNGIPVRQRVLQHGDRIEFGSSMLLFVEHEDIAPQDVSFSEEALNAKSIVTIQWDSTPNRPKSSQELSMLLGISNTISLIRDLNSLGNNLLDFAFANLPCTRGAIFLKESHSDYLELLCQKEKQKTQKSFRINKQTFDQVIKNKTGLLANNVQIADLSASVVCSPFILFDEVIGVLYLDTLGTTAELDENNLELVSAIAAIASPAIKNVQDLESLQEKTKQLTGELRMERQLIGESMPMKKVISMITKIASADSTVLITGESGTGKEVAARAIHENSFRSDQPFVAINCAALPEGLMESELFGHEKGAFTGAISQKKGKLEAANHGTLFLDEVGELDPGLQAKLLRVLQEREFERIGGTQTIKTDIRLLAATNRDLEKMANENQFRQDLYYRLNVVMLKMPALRELGDDILLLARYLISKFNRKFTRQVRGISPEAQQLLLCYDWPGNVRELENIIERAILLGSTEMILPEDLPESMIATDGSSPGTPKTLHESVNEHKKMIILKALDEADSNFNSAAAKLGIHTAHLYRLVRELKLTNQLKK